MAGTDLIVTIVDLDPSRRSFRRLPRKSGHKKSGLNGSSAGIILSPACLASFLTWLQAGRLKRPRNGIKLVPRPPTVKARRWLTWPSGPCETCPCATASHEGERDQICRVSNMSKPPPSPPSLAELRQEIDSIDAQVHSLLMQRGDIIDRLIQVKHTQEVGSAFRPAREADMMRRLVQRHRGILPLDAVESIWRVIISTFTYVQAPFSVHADISLGEPAMRDSVRFNFGF